MSKNKTNTTEIINREELLQQALQTIIKEYGRDAVVDMNKKLPSKDNVISSGSLLLDMAIGIGGYPRGRVIEVYGAESSGKTTLALHAISEVQKSNGKAAFIDVEYALDPNYAQKIGVILEQLIIVQPDSGEQALGILEVFVKSNAIDLIVIDSVAALTPQVELDGEMSDQTIGAQARLMSKALRKLNSYIAKTNCLVFFINQIREKVGIIFGNPEITPGGRALRFYSSLRVELRRSEQILLNNQLVGYKTKVKIVKNKVAAPFQMTVLDIYFDRGICKLEELISLGLKANILQKNGSWYNYGEQKLGLGRDKVREFFIANVDLQEQLHCNVAEWLQTVK
ncbi:recombinase RecA [Spiroplasma endosymbiont of Lonchoptera lutea]|uniref:recombinase RecA n=1 Tax=Spiroplasma endosymbiont of Lonchoptera lutea TaxID=3066297 RepID=UPI0030D2DEDE